MSINGKAEAINIQSVLKGKIHDLPKVDITFTKSGCAADAKATGETLNKLKAQIDNIDPHFADNVIYDNTNSKLKAEDMQNAVDELHTKLYSDFFGVHNKPIKTYKGNGNATIRQIQIGGVGGWLALRTDSSIIGIVTFNGAVVFSLNSNTMSCLKAEEINFRDGVLTISTANNAVNYTDVTYTCKVL